MTDTPTNITRWQLDTLDTLTLTEPGNLQVITQDTIDSLRAALHTLRKLPVTADGVIMLPGELVYTQGAGYAVAPGCVGSGAPIQTTRGAVVRVSNCYSTEQAAREAAGDNHAQS